MIQWFYDLVDFYRRTPWEALPESVRHQMKRCLLDTTGCMLAAADSARREERWIRSLGGDGACRMVGTEQRFSAAQAGFYGSVLAAALEMDDATSVGASVHPGCCVIPAALAAGQAAEATGNEVLKAMAFGYDLCNRLGLLATEKIREFGLYGPGVIAGPCAAGVYGFLTGQTTAQMENALAIALAMLPICPFSAFTDGADSKLFYTGWGTYLGVCACSMTQAGFSGPKHILSGQKSLEFLFASGKGTDLPAETCAFADAVVFKDYAACLSVHATMTALETLSAREPLAPGEIEDILVETYPYACELSDLAEELNEISARVSLPYAVAARICTGCLDPEAFTEECLSDARIRELCSRIRVKADTVCDAGPFGSRGSTVSIRLKNGEVRTASASAGKWNKLAPPSDEELLEKFGRITGKYIKNQRREALVQEIFAMEQAEDLEGYFRAACISVDGRKIP